MTIYEIERQIAERPWDISLRWALEWAIDRQNKAALARLGLAAVGSPEPAYGGNSGLLSREDE